VVLAEAVGSCTDLQSTVIRPLRALYADELWVSPLSVLVDPIRYAAISQLWDRLDTEPDLAYLYRHQLDEADIIVLNKVDLLDSGEVRRLCEDLQRRFPHAHVAALSATTGEGLDDLLSLWTGHASEGHRPFEVDYKRYGAAEAELAWTNQTFELTASERDFVPAAWVQEFLSHIGETMRARCIVIGHLKIRVATSEGTTKASLTGPPDPSYDDQQWVPVGSGSVTLNARVQVDPDALDVLIAQSVAAADRAARTKSSPRRGNIFRPGFPVPVHRM
jgi:G3E family GTPase